MVILPPVVHVISTELIAQRLLAAAPGGMETFARIAGYFER